MRMGPVDFKLDHRPTELPVGIPLRSATYQHSRIEEHCGFDCGAIVRACGGERPPSGARFHVVGDHGL
jgi:hypothetical protein